MWSPFATLGPPPGAVHSAIGSFGPTPDKLTRMNPRYRRMVIPGALVGLILIVAIAAALRR